MLKLFGDRKEPLNILTGKYASISLLASVGVGRRCNNKVNTAICKLWQNNLAVFLIDAVELWVEGLVVFLYGLVIAWLYGVILSLASGFV